MNGNIQKMDSIFLLKTFMKYCLKMPLRSYSQNTPIQICQIKIFLYLRSVFFQTKPVLMFGHFFKMSTHSTEDVNAWNHQYFWSIHVIHLCCEKSKWPHLKDHTNTISVRDKSKIPKRNSDKNQSTFIKIHFCL